MTRQEVALTFVRTRRKSCVLQSRPEVCRAKVAELVDALDLGSSGATRAGSIPVFRTNGLGCFCCFELPKSTPIYLICFPKNLMLFLDFFF